MRGSGIWVSMYPDARLELAGDAWAGCGGEERGDEYLCGRVLFVVFIGYVERYCSLRMVLSMWISTVYVRNNSQCG